MMVLITVVFNRIVRNTLFCTILQKQGKVEGGFYMGGIYHRHSIFCLLIDGRSL